MLLWNFYIIFVIISQRKKILNCKNIQFLLLCYLPVKKIIFKRNFIKCIQSIILYVRMYKLSMMDDFPYTTVHVVKEFCDRIVWLEKTLHRFNFKIYICILYFIFLITSGNIYEKRVCCAVIIPMDDDELFRQRDTIKMLPVIGAFLKKIFVLRKQWRNI